MRISLREVVGFGTAAPTNTREPFDDMMTSQVMRSTQPSATAHSVDTKEICWMRRVSILTAGLLSGCIVLPREQKPPFSDPVDASAYVGVLAAHAGEADGRFVVAPVGVIARQGGLEVHVLVMWPGADPNERMQPDAAAPGNWRPERGQASVPKETVTGNDAETTFDSPPPTCTGLGPRRTFIARQLAESIGRTLSDNPEAARNIVVERADGRRESVKPMQRFRRGGIVPFTILPFFDIRRDPAARAVADDDGRWGFVQLVLVRTKRELKPGSYTLRLTRTPRQPAGRSREDAEAWLRATDPKDVRLGDEAVGFEVERK
jgi:hypothetical protein